MHADLFRLALRTPIPASILEIPDQFLLFRIHQDRRLTTVEEPATSALRCSNCAFRSGCEAPSRVLRLPCKLYPASSSKVATVLWLTGCVCRANSSANVRVLLIVHRSGDSGSPREVGSTKPSSAGSNCGSFRIARRRPPPGRRMRSAAARPFRVAGPSTPRFQRERWMATCALLLPQPSRLPNPFPGPRSPPTTAATARSAPLEAVETSAESWRWLVRLASPSHRTIPLLAQYQIHQVILLQALSYACVQSDFHDYVVAETKDPRNQWTNSPLAVCADATWRFDSSGSVQPGNNNTNDWHPISSGPTRNPGLGTGCAVVPTGPY